MAEIERVVILMTNTPQPVYHRLGEVIAFSLEDGRYVDVTACGRKDHPYCWWEARLRRDHAELFARPCVRCFPEARS